MNTKPILKQLLDSCFFLEIAFYVFVLNCGNWKPIHTNKFLTLFEVIKGGGPRFINQRQTLHIYFYMCLRLGHKQKMHRNACPGKRWATPLLESRALKHHLPAKTKQIRAIYWSKDLHRRSILVSTWWSHMLLWLTTASAIWASMYWDG